MLQIFFVSTFVGRGIAVRVKSTVHVSSKSVLGEASSSSSEGAQKRYCAVGGIRHTLS